MRTRLSKFVQLFIKLVAFKKYIVKFKKKKYTVLLLFFLEFHNTVEYYHFIACLLLVIF